MGSPVCVELYFGNVDVYMDYILVRTHDFGTFTNLFSDRAWRWSGGAIVLGKHPVPGRPTILITVGQGPLALAVGAGGVGLDIFTLIYPFSSFSLSLGDI